jgi:hypothetical protein
MRTTEFICESSELTVLPRLYDRGRRVPGRSLQPGPAPASAPSSTGGVVPAQAVRPLPLS